jgi:hypothetical protein
VPVIVGSIVDQHMNRAEFAFDFANRALERSNCSPGAARIRLFTVCARKFYKAFSLNWTG